MQNIEDFYRDMYWKELERKDRLHAQLTLPTSIIIILAGVVVYYWKTILPFKWELWFIIMGCCSIILSIAIIIVVYYLWHAYAGHTYQYLVTPKNIEQHRVSIFNHYHALSDPDMTSRTEEDITSFLISTYLDSTEVNTRNNDERFGWLYRANTAIKWLLICLLLSFIPFLIVSSLITERIQKIEIVSTEKGGQVYGEREKHPKTTTETTTETKTTTTKDDKRRTNTTKEKIKQQEK